MIRRILTGLAAAALTVTVAATGCQSGGSHPCFSGDPGSNGCHHHHHAAVNAA